MKKMISLAGSLMLLLILFIAAFAQGGKPTSCGADVPLIVTFRDFIGNPTNVGDKLYSDLSTYTDGVNGVYAKFQVSNCTSDFIFNLDTTRSKVYLDARDENKIADGVVNSPNRMLSSTFFNFDRIEHIPVTPTTPVGTPYDSNTEFGRFCENLNPDNRQNVQYGGCQQDSNTGQWYVRRALTSSFTDGAKGEYPLRFQKPPEGTLFTSAEINTPFETAYIKVYHPNANTWVLTPESAQVGGPVATLFTKLNRQYYRSGQFLIPFQITLTRK